MVLESFQRFPKKSQVTWFFFGSVKLFVSGINTIQRVNRYRLPQMNSMQTTQEVIDKIRIITDLVLESKGIYVLSSREADPEGSKLLNYHRKINCAIATWLEHLWLHNKTSMYEAHHTDKVAFYHQAEWIDECSKIATRVIPRSSYAQQLIPSGPHWAAMILFHETEKDLITSGYMGEPTVTSKQRLIKGIREETTALEDWENFKVKEWKVADGEEAECLLFAKTLKGKFPIDPYDFLKGEAVALCKQDQTFRNHWREYLRTCKRILRSIERSKTSVAFINTDGLFKISKRGKQRKTLIKS